LLDFFDEDETLKIRIFLFSSQINSGQPQKVDCNDFGFFTLQEAGKLDLAPADRKIYSYLLKREF